MFNSKKVKVDSEFLYFLLRDKLLSICEGDCDTCIFNEARKKYKVKVCDEMTPEQLLISSEKQFYNERGNTYNE